MALAPGDRLGPYEVLSQIGAGGMGEVYQAYDSRLERHVAIKVSRDQYTERFTREALAIAALNHTNVCHLYDVGPNYIVLEYVEGTNLEGPVPFEQALPLIHQLIDGIEAAHERGIVHRDLKPANIRVTSDGVLKILDFGLAKAAGPDTTGADPANSPTLTSPAGTMAGTILGTAAYMSPEQARGRTADRRSDIFAFGVVVYELLTGKGPFAGETAIESMGAVMNREPDWSQVPPRAERLLRWCLEKDRKQRLASISDARRVLAEDPLAAQPVPAARKRTSLLPWAIAAAAVLGLTVTAWKQSEPILVPVLQSELSLPGGWDISRGALGGVPALSPDGTKLVLPARAAREDVPRLYLRVLSSGGYTEVPQSEGAQAAFWSPDSQWVAYASNGKLLKWNPSSAALPQTIGNADVTSGSWGEDGTILLWTINGNKPLQRIPASGGVVRNALALDEQFGEESQLVPHFLPGGQAFLYQSNGRGVRGATFFATLDGKIRRQLSVDPGGPPQFVAAPDGQGYIVRTAADQLFAVPFDPEKGEYTGEPRLLADQVRTGPFFSLSRTGLLVHAPQAPLGSTLQWSSRSGELGQVVYENDMGMGAGRISPDGTRVAFVVRGSAKSELFAQELASKSRQRIDSARAIGNYQWTKDGHLLYGRRVELSVPSQLVDRSVDDGTETILGEFPGTVSVQSISADGSLVSFALTGDGERDAYLISRPGGTPRKIGTSTVMLSPDGKWAASVLENRLSFRAVRTGSDVSLGAEIGSVEIPEGSARWSRDGNEIVLVGRAVHTVPIDWTGGTPHAGTPRKLFDLPDAIGMDVTPDGQRFLMQRSAAATGPQPPLVLTQNWYRLFDR